MRYLTLLLCLLQFQLCLAQVNDDFSDGDFSNDPTWSGDDADFDASSEQLRLNIVPGIESESYISTPQNELGQTTWEFYFRLAFSPSDANRTRIYLVSEQADLSTYPDGYFLLVGEGGSSDVLRFYSRDGGSNSLLFSGTTDLSSSFEIWVQVVRDADGNWEVKSSSDGINPYSSEGSSFSDVTHTTSEYFGFWCDYTSSNSTKFYFDDISITTTPVVPSFGVSSLTKEGNNAMRVTFNQNVDETSGETLSNYSLNYGFGNPILAERDLTNLDEVLLTFSDEFVNNDYTLNIDQVENEATDEIISNDNQAFNVEQQTPFRNIVINEIMADPSPVVGLPDAEYIELYNPSDHAINIGDFMIDARTLDDFVLESNTYVTLTSSANAGLFSGEVIGLSGLSLGNGGETLELTDNLGNLVDSVSYTIDWYQDTEKDDGGYSLEQINPELMCSYENNWIVSNHTDGGTPGNQNSVYDNSSDNQGPNLIDFVAIDANTFRLTFDEPMDESSLTSATYTFDNGIIENGIAPISPGFLSALIDVTPDLTSGTTYTVIISGATDCAGNAIETNSLSFTFDTNPPELDRMVVKSTTEIQLQFNEDLDKSIAETESNYSSDHEVNNPSSAELDEADLSIVKLTFDEEFSIGIENTLTIENIEDVLGNALTSALTPTFTYTQDIDSVHVIGINLLDVYFTQEPEASSATNTDNYLVDNEVGNPSSAFIDSGNDQLVHLAFANNFDDNKNLTLAISNIKNLEDEYLTTPELTFIYDTSPPKLDTLIVSSAKSLEIVFAEKVETQSAQSKENYEYEDIYPINASLDADQKTVFLEFEKKFEREVVFELFIDEVKDHYDNEIKTRIKQEFVYDVFAPELDSIIVKSSDQLILWFNENVDITTTENLTNYLIADETPTKVSLDREHQNQVYLELNSELPEESGIALEILDIQDQRSNNISSAVKKTFGYDKFYLGRIQPLSKNNIQIEFNKVPDASSKNTLTNYLLNEEPASSISFSEDRIAIVAFASNLTDNSENQLVIQNINDQNSNPLSISSYYFKFDSRIFGSGLVGDRTVALEFEVGLDPDQDLSTTDFNTTPYLGNCVATVIDAENSAVLRLTFEKALVPDTPYTVAWQNLTNEFGNRLPDYFTSIIKDQTPPSIKNYLVLNENSIWLQFSEPLNETSAEFLLNYQITPDIGYPASAKYVTADFSVLLEFSASLIEDVSYQLTIDNIEDLSDNALFDYQIDFNYEVPEKPEFGDLIITEIMADPTPEVGLSDKEYIEIYNTTDQAISLIGLSLVDEGGATTIVSGEIEGQSYLVLTSTSGVANFPDISALGVTSFPSLNNTGETISIYAGENLIFSTSYDSDWYKNTDKQDGGWSLEMIDTNNPCGEYNNWTASTNVLGGTPGLSNSVTQSNPDNFGPQLVSAIATDENTIELTLNEKLHPESFKNIEVQLNPTLTITSVYPNEPKNTQIDINLDEGLIAGQVYEIEISKITDCLSNIIDGERNSAQFRLAEEAEPSDIIINEVLFNPRAGGVDFVEIYNNSAKAINLKDWMLGDKLSDQKVITQENLVLDPSEYLVLTTDPKILITEYPKGDASRMITMASFPGLSDDEDSVLLMSNYGILIDEMKYEDDYHFNLLDDDEGVSLEKISFEAKSLSPDSWKSAASTVGFATPGVTNSQTKSNNQTTATVSIEPSVFIPDNTGINDYTTITYQLDQSGNFANVHVYSVNGVLVKTLAEGELLSTTGFFTWDGTTNSGSQAAVGYYMVLFEIFGGNGNKSLQKETVVLGARF